MKKTKRMSPYTKIVLSFVLIILVGGTILSLPISTTNGNGTRWIDGIFTATSAVCVTGLVVNDVSLVYNLFGKTIILLLIQTGGLGVLTVSSLFMILVSRKISYNSKKVVQESLNYGQLLDIQKYVKKAVFTVVLIEFMGAFILFFEFIKKDGFLRAIYNSIFHSVSAFCNAGFALFTLNLEDFKGSAIVNLTIPALIVLGGLGFSTILNVSARIKDKRTKLTLNTKLVLVVSAALIVVGTVLTMLLEYNNPKTLGTLSLIDKFYASLLQSISTRTAGFNTISIGGLLAPTIFLYVILMFIGASPGSTGGGIKTTTFGIIMTGIYGTIRGKRDIELWKRKIPWDVFNKAVSLVSIAILYVSIVVFSLTLIEKNQSFLSLLFESVSAFATVGLSVGITPTLSDAAKWILILTMFVGRVGPLTIALVLSTATKVGNTKYPEENILI